VRYTRAPKTSQAENTLRVEAKACGKACGNFHPLRTPKENTKDRGVNKKMMGENNDWKKNILSSSLSERRFSKAVFV
jgi:hypothetical protein